MWKTTTAPQFYIWKLCKERYWTVYIQREQSSVPWQVPTYDNLIISDNTGIYTAKKLIKISSTIAVNLRFQVRCISVRKLPNYHKLTPSIDFAENKIHSKSAQMIFYNNSIIINKKADVKSIFQNARTDEFCWNNGLTWLQKRQMNVTIFMKMKIHYFWIGAYANDIRQ